MQLLQFHAGGFCRISGVLSQAWVLLNHGSSLDAMSRHLGGSLGELQRECERLALPHTLTLLRRTLGEIDAMQNGASLLPLSRRLTQIYERLTDELDLRLTLTVPAERASYFTDGNLFGDQVSTRFPSARTDIEEAGKCLALNRNTACMFHLMRVTELGLRALASSLGDPHAVPIVNPSWESLLKKCDAELAKPIAHRSAEWRTDDPFFSTAVANLRAVKSAWRNPTMHIDQTYSDEIALEVWNALRGFMRHLATKLREVSTEPASSRATLPE